MHRNTMIAGTGKRIGAAVLAIAMPAGVLLGAQQADATPRAAEEQLPPEAVVLSKMHQTNQMEIEAGELAMKRGGSEDVQRYGDRLRRDHRMNDQKVKSMASDKGFTLVEPEPQSKEEKKRKKQQKETMAKLRELEGEQFDAVFLEFMVQGHEHAIETLTKALEEKLEDPDVRDLVEKSIPILQQHLALARELRGESAPAR